MQTNIKAPRRRSRLPWVLAALALFATGLIVPSAGASVHQQGGVAASWADYQPRGWSAGSVSRGTGYHRPGASLRVRDVQRRLNRLGYRSGKVDGFFGPITDTAVRGYQSDRALAADGIVGPRTLRDLHAQTRTARTADRQQRSSGTTITGAGENSPVDVAALWAAGLGLLVLLGLLARRPLSRAADRARERIGSTRGQPSHPRTLFVEGHSEDRRIGDFSGFAYTIWP